MEQFNRAEYDRLLADVLDHEEAANRRRDRGAPIQYPPRETKRRLLFGRPLTVYAAEGGRPRHFAGPRPLIAFRDGGSAEAKALFADGYLVTSEHA